MDTNHLAQVSLEKTFHGSGASRSHRTRFFVAAAMATVEQMTSEITILRTQLNDVLSRVQSLEGQQVTLFAQIGTVSGQLSEMSSKQKVPKSVLTSKGVSDVPTYDGRAETFEDWLFKVKNYFESEDSDFCAFLNDIEDYDEEVTREWMRSYKPDDIETNKVEWLNRQLYLFLAQKTSGNPLQTVKNLEEDVECRGAAAWAKIVKAGKGRNANRALIVTGKIYNPKRVDKYSEVLPAFESWESYVKEFERDTNSRMAEVTKMNSLRQLVPKELELDALGTKKSKDSPYVPMDIGNIDDASSNDEEEIHHDLAVMKGDGKGEHFPGYCNYCWKFGHKVSQCHQKTTDMKGKGKGGQQEKGKGKGFWEGAKGIWGSGKSISKGHKGSGKNMWTSFSPTWGGWTKGQGKGLHLWGTDESFDSSAGLPATSPSLFHIGAGTACKDSYLPNISVVPARLPIETHNPFDILTECNDDDDTVDDSIPNVGEVEWLVLTKSHHRCAGRTWPKGSHKRKTKFVRFHEDPCDLVNGEANNLNFLGSHDCSVRVTAIMDSGAAGSVAPLDFAKNIPLKDSEGSRRGQVYHGAAGDKIANRGEKQINAVTESGDAYNATYQIAAVTKPLNSISKICDRGNTVIFGSNGGVIVVQTELFETVVRASDSKHRAEFKMKAVQFHAGIRAEPNHMRQNRRFSVSS